MTSADMVVLSAGERATLVARSRRVIGAHRDVLRARIVLAAADGQANAVIARWLDVCVDTVRKWRRRFCAQRLKGLEDRARSGRPRVFATVAVAQVRALACSLPAEFGVPLSRWSSTELAGEAVARGIVGSVSGSSVRRWLAADAIKPWQHRSWIFPRDPQFAVMGAAASGDCCWVR